MKVLLSGTLLFISSFVIGQNLTQEEMMKLMPDKINGYRQTETPKSNHLKIGDISYTICQKGFSSGSKHITFLLFDFKNAPVMYNQVTREWTNYQEVDSDSLILKPIVQQNYSGWELDNTNNRSSRIFLGVSNRFYLAIDGRNVGLEDLRAIIKLFSLEVYPE